ncbi:MAG: nitroreductase family protein [Phycisphaerae bacterium]|nr:nitroreductase family protein [Phycisphaerae bacterium]
MSQHEDGARITISSETCTRCGRCIVTCPRKLLVREGDEVRSVADLSLCIECGHCVAVCEPGALRHAAIAADATPDIGDLALTDVQLEQFLRRRRSIRKFKSKPVEPEKLDRLFDIARYAPTGKNRQGVLHTVLTADRIMTLERTAAQFYRKLIGRLESPIGRWLVGRVVGQKNLGELLWGLGDLKRDVEQVERGEPTYCHDAPVVVIVSGEASSTIHEDCSYAAYHLMLAAETLELGTCLIGYITAAAARLKAVRDVAELPPDHQVYSTVAIGYPAERFYRLVPRREANVRHLS